LNNEQSGDGNFVFGQRSYQNFLGRPTITDNRAIKIWYYVLWAAIGCRGHGTFKKWFKRPLIRSRHMAVFRPKLSAFDEFERVSEKSLPA